MMGEAGAPRRRVSEMEDMAKTVMPPASPSHRLKLQHLSKVTRKVLRGPKGTNQIGLHPK